MTIEEILRENARRLEEIGREFDPMSGCGSTGKREAFNVEGIAGPLYLPEMMLREGSLAWNLRNAGSVDAYLKERLGRTEEDGDRELLMARFDQERCRHDFPYWAATRIYIKDKRGGEDILFRLNRPQRKFVERLEEDRLAGRPIRLILLKARQWGGSTCSQLYMAWLQLVHRKGLNSLIIAHQNVGSDEIKDMFDRMLSAYPEGYLYYNEEDDCPGRMPKGGKRIVGVGHTRALQRVEARNFKIKIGTAERPDSCRGGDYSLVHCSEVGVWKTTLGKTPEQILRSACSGVLLEPMTMIVYESTANGTGTFFHREYEAAKRGESQFGALFISWFDIDQYSIELDESGRREWARKLLGGRNVEAAASDREQPGAYLWWLWEQGATLEALAWYVAERSKYSDHGLMAAEYPSDDVEAFVHSGSRVFDCYKVETLREGCRKVAERGEIDVDGVASIGARFLCDSQRGEMLRHVEFRPLESGGWRVWKHPGEGDEVRVGPGMKIRDRYLAVVDVGGRGDKSDWSVICIFDRGPMAWGDVPEVVAQWRGHTDMDILAWQAAMAAKYYDEALLVIESNTLETHDRERDIDGDLSGFILNRLRDVYPNLYARPRGPEEIRMGAPVRYGFHTNVATKPMIIATLVKAIREGLYVERDEMCLDEFLSYERRQNGSFGAISGRHDDLLMTRAIGLHICFHEMDLPRIRTSAGCHGISGTADQFRRRRPAGWTCF